MGTRRRFTPEYRRDVASLVLDTGSSIASVARDLGLGESVVGRWVKLERERRQAAREGRPDPRELEAEITARAEGARAGEGERVLGKSQRLLRVSAPKHQRFELMDAQKASYSIALMAKVLGVTRAGYYAWKNRAPQRGKRASARRRLDEAVAWEHEVSGGTYGAPRIRHALTRAGVDVGVRAVAASMRRQGLTGLNTHPRPSRRGGRGPVAHEDHCARQWDQGALDRVWITDFTYLRCAQGWVYLCAVRDAHSRRVLGYAMGEQQSTDLVITALDMAATTRGGFPTGVVLHADRGTQFTSQKLAAYMRAVKGTVSMGQAGVCWDNAMAESFWATLTSEYYYRRAFTTRDQVYTGVATWIEDFYNRRRIHTSLGGKSPIEYELHQAAWTKAA